MPTFTLTYNAKLDDGDTFTEEYSNMDTHELAAVVSECHRRAAIKSYIVGYEIIVVINRKA